MNHFYESIDGFSAWKEQGELLHHLLPLVRTDMEPLTVAEIGVYKGRMTAMWCVEMIRRGIELDYWAVDHFLGSAEHEHGVDYPSQFKENLKPIFDRYDKPTKNGLYVIQDNSVQAAERFEDETFDIVYLDASHNYDSVCADIDAWCPKVRKGGVLCGDDYIAGWPGVMLAVNQNFQPEVNKVGRQQWWIKK